MEQSMLAVHSPKLNEAAFSTVGQHALSPAAKDCYAEKQVEDHVTTARRMRACVILLLGRSL